MLRGNTKELQSYTRWLRNGTSIYYNEGSLGVGTNNPTAIGGTVSLSLKSAVVDSDVRLGISNDVQAWVLRTDGGDSDTFKIRDATTGNDRFAIDTSGNVGIGTTTPSRELEVAASADSSEIEVSTWSTTDADRSSIVFQKSASATVGTYATTATGESLARIVAAGVDTSNTPRNAGQILIEGDAAPDANAVPGKISFWTSNLDSLQERMVIDDSGQVGIGEDTPAAALHVKSSTAQIHLEDSTAEDVDQGRTSVIKFKGTQSGGEVTTLAQIKVNHDGALDDEKGRLILGTNDGSDGDVPTDRVTIDSNGKVTLNHSSGTNALVIRELDDGNDAIRFQSDNTDGIVVMQSAGVTTTRVASTGTNYFNNGSLALGSTTAETQFHNHGGFSRNVTTVNAATYDLLVTDDILNVTYTGTGAVTSLTLPTAQCTDGRVIVVKDAGYNATTNNVTIDTEGAELINNAATYVISSDGEAVTLYADGSNWHAI